VSGGWLEHRIPPPVVGAVVAAGMWVLARKVGILPLPDFGLKLLLTALLAAVGLAFDLAGLRAFLARRTTINPLRPERASSLVTDGVYRITRNPMYIGMVFLLLAWGVHLADVAALLLGPLAYVLYLNRFQIAPEERILLGLFGDDYRAYMGRVRRWV
jgi:protein-S-isoprenylcysteine O-methyltransferase Ste14